ncbi:alcohol dehydrogenase, partial [Streptomyces rubellomurinus subsp. indigoferus]
AALGARVVHDVAAAQGPFDVVLASTGGPNLPVALSKVRPGGLLAWFGQASRPPATLHFFDLLNGPARVTIQHFHYPAAPYGHDLAALLPLVEPDRLPPDI